MIKLKGIDHLVINTFNIQKMLGFYCEVLGDTLERTQEKFGLYQLRVGDSLIDLLKVDGKPNAKEQNMAHFCLRVQDFDYEEISEHLKSHNIEPERLGNRYGAEGSGQSCYIFDPEGNEIELKESK